MKLLPQSHNNKVVTKRLSVNNPLTKSREFNITTSLMKQTFKRPEQAPAKYAPVIEAYSRTLAAPYATQGSYLSVSQKIGSNYTPSAKALYFDSEARMLKFKETGAIDSDAGCGKLPSGVYAEQTGGQAQLSDLDIDPQKVKARKDAYARYLGYIEHAIPTSHIAPIRQYWLNHIIELVPRKLDKIAKNELMSLMSSMLDEINHEYIASNKKSILGYILRDESEQRRLGIQQISREPTEWGKGYYNGVEATVQMKSNHALARMLLTEGLCVQSQANIELRDLWQQYKHLHFVELADPTASAVPLKQFLEAQDSQMVKVQVDLIKKWNPAAAAILKDQLANLGSFKASNIVESLSTQMSNQARELVEQSVKAYVNFIQGFKLSRYATPEEVMHTELDVDSPFYHSFITLKLAVDGERIVFSDTLQAVKYELENIVDMIVAQSQNIPRAENSFSAGDRVSLWDVKTSDEFVVKAKRQISEVLDANLEVVEQALHIFDEHSFILKEKERLEVMLGRGDFDRESLQTEIDNLTSYIDKIGADVPFEIRMNMFLIDCREIRSILIDECEDISKMILDKVGDHTFHYLAPKIYNEVHQISKDLSQKATNSQQLVALEAIQDHVEKYQRKELIYAYGDLVQWILMLNENPRFTLTDASIQAVGRAYNLFKNLDIIIATSQQKLLQERYHVEQALEAQMHQFQVNIEEVDQLVAGFKDKDFPLFADAYCQEIKDIDQTLADLSHEEEQIHQQQDDLNQPREDFPRLQELKVNLVSYEELWNLQLECKEKIRQWTSSKLAGIPEDFEENCTRMLKVANKLIMKFEGYLPKPKRVATKIRAELDGCRQQLVDMATHTHHHKALGDSDVINEAETAAEEPGDSIRGTSQTDLDSVKLGG